MRLSYLWKLHNKVSYGASGFCENYTRKTPLYIYYIISTGADAACVFLATCYTVIVPMRCGTQEKGDGTTIEWTGREAKPAKLAVLPTGRRGETPGKESIVKVANKLKFVYRCFIVGAVIAAGLLLSALIRWSARRPRNRAAQFQKVYDLLTIIINW